MGGAFVNKEQRVTVEIEGGALFHRVPTGIELARSLGLRSERGQAEANIYLAMECLTGWKGEGFPEFPEDPSDALAMLEFEPICSLVNSILTSGNVKQAEAGN